MGLQRKRKDDLNKLFEEYAIDSKEDATLKPNKPFDEKATLSTSNTKYKKTSFVNLKHK